MTLAGAWSPLRPPPLLTVSQWADRYRRLGSISSAEPGRWRTDRTPYLREPMDRLSATDPCEWVVLMFGAQLGKTEAGLNWLGYIAHHQPAPVLAVQPTIEMAETYSEQRLGPMIADCPELASLFGDPKTRDAKNRKLQKMFPGGMLRLTGANAPASLASMPIRYVFGDEIDRWPMSAGAEGSPLGLIERRTSSFSRRKILLTSTPTIRGASLVEAEMTKTGWRRYWVPCPHCGHMQTLRWEGLHWPAGKPRQAEYHCAACGAGIRDTERTKTEMLRHGEWRPDYPDREDGTRYGYHLPTLYAPGGWSPVCWGALAESWVSANGDPAALQVVVNTVLAETWDDTGSESIDLAELEGRGERYEAEVPAGVALLTAGADVQVDRIEVEVVGWGAGEESWSIDYAVLPGDPTLPQVWDDLEVYLSRRWRHATAGSLGVAVACVDANYQTEKVSDWIAQMRRNGRRWYAVRGSGGPGKPLWPRRAGRAKKGAHSQIWTLGVDSAKDAIWSRWQAKTGAGAMHWPAGRDVAWLRMMTAERPRVRRSHGRPVREWVRVGSQPAEALDCRVYAMAALASLSATGMSLEAVHAALPHGAGEAAAPPQRRRQQPRAVAPPPPPVVESGKPGRRPRRWLS